MRHHYFFHRFALAIATVLLLLSATAQGAPESYRLQILTDGPFGYWRFGELTGTAAADSSTRGNNGTYSGGITLGQPGFHGGDTAALFDGANGRVVVPNSVSLNPANITMEAKVRWDGRNGFQQRILEKSFFIDPGQEQAQYGLSILDDGRVRVELRTGAAGADPVCGTPNNVVCANSTATVIVGVETHIAATYDFGAREVRIYINGALDSVTTAVAAGPIEPVLPDPQHVPNDALGIGNQSVRNRPFKGLIDEVALFDRALSADRILAHFRSQFEDNQSFEYAVKFVCGKADGPVVAPGTYFTAINVHNPSERSVGFRKKFAIALPGERAGRVSRFFDAKLGPDEAFEIDCPDILRKTETHEGFVKGFAVIKTNLQLDVVAVYTAAGATGTVETMHMERVPARLVPRETH